MSDKKTFDEGYVEGFREGRAEAGDGGMVELLAGIVIGAGSALVYWVMFG